MLRETGFSDLRYALRALGTRPTLSLIVVLTLGLGLGATTAIFSVVDSLLLRDPPFREPDRLVQITSTRGGEAGGAIAVPEFDDLRALPVFEDAAMFTDQWTYKASDFDVPEVLQATTTTHNLFQVLGVEPYLGSTFPADFDRTRNFGLVLTHGLWTRAFAQEAEIVGKPLTLDGAPGYTIYGVMPQGFAFPGRSELFRSIGIQASPTYYERRDIRLHTVIARLAPGVSLANARSAIDGLAHRLEREFPETNGGLRFEVKALREVYSGAVRPYVLLLFGGAILVLIAAGANVVNLLLSRAVARDREMALRMALGASRWRIVRAFLAESFVLTAGGAALGAVIAVGAIRVFSALVPVPLPAWMELRVDARFVRKRRIARSLGVAAQQLDGGAPAELIVGADGVVQRGHPARADGDPCGA